MRQRPGPVPFRMSASSARLAERRVLDKRRLWRKPKAQERIEMQLSAS